MKNLSIEQFVSGTLVEFKDGEIWKVEATNSCRFVNVTMRPYNELAIENSGFSFWTFGLHYIKANAVTILF